MFRSLIVLVISLVFSSLVIADAGDKTIMLSGKQLSEKQLNKISMKGLEADFKLQTFDVYNPWEKRKDSYSGVLLNELVSKYAPNSQSLVVTAIDDYQVTITAEDWHNMRILLATKVNDRYIDVKNKGPMRIVFPDYDVADKRYELSLPKWMWMIKRLEFN